MFVNEDEIVPLEPFGVVEVEGPPEGSLAIDEFVLVSVALVTAAFNRPEALTDLEPRERRLSAVGKYPEQLKAQRPVVRLENLDRLTQHRLHEHNPAALEKLGDT